MSLINEALKRARMEAARQDAAKKGYVLNAGRSPQGSPHANGRAGRIWLQAGLAVIAVTIGAGGLIYLTTLRSSVNSLSGNHPRKAATSSELELSSEPSRNDVKADSVLAGDDSVDDPDEPPQIPFQAPLENAPPIHGSTATPGSSVPASGIDDTPRLAQQVSTSGRTPPDSGTEHESRSHESYRRVFTLDDGTRIELGGIAWSETGPYALVNGRVVGEGEFVGDLVVANIQPNQIELTGPDRKVFLKIR